MIIMIKQKYQEQSEELVFLAHTLNDRLENASTTEEIEYFQYIRSRIISILQ